MFTISSKVLSPRFMGLKRYFGILGVSDLFFSIVPFILWEYHSRKPQVGILKVIYLDFIANHSSNHLWGLFPLKYKFTTYFLTSYLLTYLLTSNASIGSSKWCYKKSFCYRGL